MVQFVCSGLFLMADGADALVQVAASKAVAERIENGVGVAIVNSHLVQFREKAGSQVARIGYDLRLGNEAGDRIERDVSVLLDRSGTEFDRRNMPLAGGAQAHDETQTAFRGVVLVRVRHDRRIEDRSRFQGILAGEERPDQEPAFAGERNVGLDMPPHHFEVRQDLRFNVDVPVVELAQHLLQLGDDFRLRQRQGSFDDRDDQFRFAGNERAYDDAGAFGEQCDLVAA